jgi:signal transduction histidine kinase
MMRALVRWSRSSWITQGFDGAGTAPLAHSLSPLALQLESTRMLARSRGVDEDMTQGIDRAHRLAASGLAEARRAIAAERGDELPGPERIGTLAGAVEEQSGLPAAVGLGLNSGGYGLTGMPERAELLGGEPFAAPAPEGFRVELRLPATG